MGRLKLTILGLDPSGTYKYGSGTTGYSVVSTHLNKIKIIEMETIRAKNFLTKEEYYKAHIELIKKHKPNLIICENFILYAHSMRALSNQEMETSELIGYLEGKANEMNIEFIRQNAQLIKGLLTTKPDVFKNMVSESSGNKDLDYKINKSGSLLWTFKEKRVVSHSLDSLRHVIYYLARR